MVASTAAQPSPFHPGEVAIQTSIGVAERVEQLGKRMIRDFMLDQHRDFFAQLPFIVMGAVDQGGDVWATMLAGYPGFIRSPDPHRLDLGVTADPRDPASAGLFEGSSIGLLGIELQTRRRNRMNGRVALNRSGCLTVAVAQSFGNCPQYIRRRDWQMTRDPANHAALPAALALDPADPRVAAIVTAADTFFVASYAEDAAGRHVDASHRGGKHGFVRVDAAGTLTIPDYAGNQFFNTLGNLLVNPRAGLIFPDFATGTLLQLTGAAAVVLDSPELDGFAGAQRLWTLRPRRAVLREGALPLRFADCPASQRASATHSIGPPPGPRPML